MNKAAIYTTELNGKIRRFEVFNMFVSELSLLHFICNGFPSPLLSCLSTPPTWTIETVHNPYAKSSGKFIFEVKGSMKWPCK